MKAFIKKIIKGLPGIRTIIQRLEKLENNQKQLNKICQTQKETINDLQKRASGFEKEIGKLRKDCDKLHKDCDKLRKDCDKLRVDRDELCKSQEKLRGDQEQLFKDRDSLRRDRDSLRKSIDGLWTDRDMLRKDLYNIKTDLKYYYNKSLLPQQYEECLIDAFYEATGDKLNLKNPITFNEKIQWMKLYDSSPIKTDLADKYLVRNYVKDKIGEDYLIQLLGVWDKFDDIDFEALPDKFVLKTNHGSYWNLIIKDKNMLDLKVERKKFHKWLSMNFAFKNALELHYKDIKPKIIAEEYLENNGGGLDDYKVFCFGGKAEYIMYLTDRGTKLKMAFYDTEWNLMPFVYNHERLETAVERPDNLELLLKLSEQLSEGFAHVRVDFYRLDDGSLKFGEMTFTSASGMCLWDPPEYNKILGDKIVLPEVGEKNMHHNY